MTFGSDDRAGRLEPCVGTKTLYGANDCLQYVLERRKAGAVSAQACIEYLLEAGQRRAAMRGAIVTLLSTDYKPKQSISASAPTAQVYGGKHAPRLERYQSGAPYSAANRAQAQESPSCSSRC
jgi:hypothetical protein